MTAHERSAIAQAALARSRAEQTEVTVTFAHQALTRFTRETVTAAVDRTDASVRVRAVVDGRIGIAATNAFDPAALDAVVARAREIAVFAPRESVPPLFAATRDIVTPAGAFVTATAGATAADLARIAGAIFEAAGDGLWCSGYATTSHDGVTLMTSNGGHVAFDGTDAGANVKMNGPDSTGFAETYAHAVTTIDGHHLGAEAARIVRATSAPTAVEPGDWSVILAPAAAGELLHYLGLHFSAEAYADGLSFLTGKLATQVVGSNVTITDDYADARHAGMPFDAEGYPTQRLTLVAKGVANDVVTDSTWAARIDRPNTGHALSAPNESGPQARHLVVAPGGKPLQTLITETPRGLLITRLWYVRVVDQRSTLLTGMTRDGTFLIENGKLTGGVHNMRFNQSIVAALDDCELGDTPVRTGGYRYSLVTPAIKFNHFRFASASPY